LSYGDVIAAKKILVCVGSGGVGKTTTAAALALEAACRGKKTLVLTIDPAKRLANSLGLSELGHEVAQVPQERLAKAFGAEPKGQLFAMMLDQKRAFDEMVSRYAKDPERVKAILANPVYQQISGSLAGSQEYAALTQLQQFAQEDKYDLIVVDTPPTAHALDFLDAPQRLSEAIDSPAIEWFRRMQGGGSWSVVGRTGNYVLKRLAKFVGSKFLDDLAVFFTEFNDILGGFKGRAEEVFDLLRQPSVGFVLVASPEPMAIREALQFHDRLVDSQMPFCGFVVNKVHEDRPIDGGVDAIRADLEKSSSFAALNLSQTSLRIAAEGLAASHAALQTLAAADLASIGHLREVMSSEEILVTVPFFSRDIYAVEQLRTVSRYLFA